jgi:hypothetical protein
MVVVSLWRPHFALAGGRKRADSKHDRDQARREEREEDWPCRELKRQGTPKQRQQHSRFGECFIGKPQLAG